MENQIAEDITVLFEDYKSVAEQLQEQEKTVYLLRYRLQKAELALKSRVYDLKKTVAK